MPFALRRVILADLALTPIHLSVCSLLNGDDTFPSSEKDDDDEFRDILAIKARGDGKLQKGAHVLAGSFASSQQVSDACLTCS
jgi:hypothetical protein